MYPPQRRGLRSTMIHDLVPLHHPEWSRRARARCTRASTRTPPGRATSSSPTPRFTADDVAATLGVRRDRLVVARPGVEPGTSADGDRAELGRPYVLGIGTLEPRKNLSRLVEAWRLARAASSRSSSAAARAGARRKGSTTRGSRSSGYVPDEDVARLYRGAAVYVYPSLYEGFGMPVVEAMACGTPVVASSHPSLDEACGDAAVRVDPHDTAAIAAGIREAVERRDELVARGARARARGSRGARPARSC